MFAKVLTYSLWGLDCASVQVEVAVSPGLPRFDVLGLADLGIRESRERIFAGIRQAGYEIPPGAITVNLAPAERKKRGASLDLPICLGILLASGQIRSRFDPTEILIAGEMGLDGRLARVNGLFNAALALPGVRAVLYPFENGTEIARFDHLEHHPSRDLGEAIDVLAGKSAPRHSVPVPSEEVPSSSFKGDFSDLYGQEVAIRAAQLAATAGLNLLFMGPPGCGKSLILRRLPSLFEPLSEAESVEVTRIHSAGGLAPTRLHEAPPFREVHPGISLAALIGGGSSPTPGEISLAHRGVLFLDELSEFPRNHLQALRVPLETGEVTVSRVTYQERFPCRFQLAAASNPCSCGHRGDPNRKCLCTETSIREFHSRLSGPLLDRIDLVLELPPPSAEEVFRPGGKSTAELRKEMEEPRAFLRENPGWLSNERLGELVETDEDTRSLVRDAYLKGHLSLRRVRSLLRVAATLALFERPGSATEERHLLAALQYGRPKWG